MGDMGDAPLDANQCANDHAKNHGPTKNFLQTSSDDSTGPQPVRLERSPRRHRPNHAQYGLAGRLSGREDRQPLDEDEPKHGNAVEVANRFNRISLGAASRLSLLDRVDVKFACDEAGVARFLETLVGTFSIVEVAGAIDPLYRSVYFDTADLDLYRDHHNARRVRHKIRYRTYLNTDTTFFEVKLRQGAERTAKHRIGVPWIPSELGAAETELLARHGITIPDARPVVDIEYRRFTLIGEGERVTIDRSLTCTSAVAQVSFDQACIIEIKQPRSDYSSPAYRAVRNAGFRARSISKYCLGVATTMPCVKSNAFKSRLRYLGQLETRNTNRAPLHR